MVLEATYGWYWAADVLAEAGANVHLAHPLGVKGFAYRRVKNDERDAADLADLLRMGRLPEAWIAPPRRCAGCARRCGTGASWSRCAPGSRPRSTRCWPSRACGCRCRTCSASAGTKLLDELRAGRALSRPGRCRCAGSSTRSRSRSTCWPSAPPAELKPPPRLPGDPGHPRGRAGAGGGLRGRDRRRDPLRPARSSCARWAGMTPRHRESDTKVHRGRITKQGNQLVRWAAVEAVQTPPRRRDRRAPGSGSPNDAARTSPRSPPPASCSPWSTTGCATGTSVAWPDQREHQLRRSQDARSLLV